MPGILGLYKKGSPEQANQLMEKMIRSMDAENRLRTDRFSEQNRGLCMGRVSLGIISAADQPVTNQEQNCFLMFHGELYGAKEQKAPEYVLKQYIEKGDACVSELNGIFHFSVYDRRTEQIKLFSDKFGLQPLYYSLNAEGILFAAEVKTILKDENFDKSPDNESFADFLHYGQILGQKTLFKNIKLLAPASVLTFNLEDFKVSLNKYRLLETLFVRKNSGDSKTSAKEVIPFLLDSILKRSENKEILGLSLSGGLDSRGILAGLGKNAEGLFTYTLGLPGCADQKLSAKMSHATKTRHEFVELDQSYLQDFETMAKEMIRLSDGMYHPHESTEMLALEYFKNTAKFKILLRGHGGEIAKAALAYPVMATSQVYSCRDSESVLNHIFNITNLVIRDIEPKKLFTPLFADVMQTSPMRSLRESCGSVSEILAPPDVCIYYYINEHIRRQVVASLDIFRTRIEIRMPYIDEAYIGNVLKLPVAARNRGEFHVEFIKKCMPELIKISDSNTGAPLDAGPLRLFLTDKFNSLMKRLSVTGFRHYTEFQKWHRDSFRENTRKIIFSEQAAARNLYNMDTLKSVFELHISGAKNYGHLLGTIVGLELWFRIFVDETENLS
jgi:asparagine synthase (glutamine-hydrolysing)